MSKDESEQRIELTYACHSVGDGRSVCGRHLAQQLVEDALKLLVPVNGGNVDAAWSELWEMAAPVARTLDDEAKSGGNPGLVLSVPAQH